MWRRRWREREAATASGVVGNDAGDGATGSEWECESVRESSTSRERERLRVRGRDWEWEREWECYVSLNLVFFVCLVFLCAWSAFLSGACDGWHIPNKDGGFLQNKPSSMNSVCKNRNRVHWTRFLVLQNESNELDFWHIGPTSATGKIGKSSKKYSILYNPKIIPSNSSW